MEKTTSITYVESSVFLSLLLQDVNFEKAVENWRGSDNKFTSFLTRIECQVAMRRKSERSRNAQDKASLRKKLNSIRQMLEKCNILNVDDRILKTIERNPALCRCRSLDAIHAGTALFLKKAMPKTRVHMLSFDTRILDVAKSLKLT